MSKATEAAIAAFCERDGWLMAEIAKHDAIRAREKALSSSPERKKAVQDSFKATFGIDPDRWGWWDLGWWAGWWAKVGRLWICYNTHDGWIARDRKPGPWHRSTRTTQISTLADIGKLLEDDTSLGDD